MFHLAKIPPHASQFRGHVKRGNVLFSFTIGIGECILLCFINSEENTFILYDAFYFKYNSIFLSYPLGIKNSLSILCHISNNNAFIFLELPPNPLKIFQCQYLSKDALPFVQSHCKEWLQCGSPNELLQ